MPADPRDADIKQDIRSAADALRFLTPDLVDLLADLHGAPKSLAQATVQLLPFGSRAALQATGCAILRKAPGDEAGSGPLKLTALAFEVMREAAASTDQPEVARLAESIRAVAYEQAGR